MRKTDLVMKDDTKEGLASAATPLNRAEYLERKKKGVSMLDAIMVTVTNKLDSLRQSTNWTN